jgi:hypothetical protein
MQHRYYVDNKLYSRLNPDSPSFTPAFASIQSALRKGDASDHHQAMSEFIPEWNYTRDVDIHSSMLLPSSVETRATHKQVYLLIAIVLIALEN